MLSILGRGNRLCDGFEDPGSFIAVVRRVDPPVAGDDFAQLGDLLRGGQGAGGHGQHCRFGGASARFAHR